MNNIATDMARLCGEIATLRDNRGALKRSLMEAAQGLHEEVSRLLAGFGEARAEMSKQTKAELHEGILHTKDVVTQLRQTVIGLRGAFLDDMEGARRAWAGAGAAPRQTPMAAEPAAKPKASLPFARSHRSRVGVQPKRGRCELLLERYGL
jgi:hypothetical protein